MARPAKDRRGTVVLAGKLLVVFGLLGALATIPAAGPFHSVAGKHQLVKETPESALFGDPGEPIGTPQVYVVPDRKMVLESKTAEGVSQLSLTKIEAAGGYPLQLVTVDVILGYARLGFGGLALLGAALAALASSKKQ